MSGIDFAKTIIGSTCIQNFVKQVNKKRKEFLTGPTKHNILTEPTNPYQELSFIWQPRAKRFVINQGKKLWGYIDVQGNIMLPVQSPTTSHIVGNIKDASPTYLSEKGTVVKN